MGGTPFLFMLFCCGVLVGPCLAYAHIVVLCFMEFLSEVPLGRICVLRCSKPGWDLNHGRSCRNSCNAFAVSGLTAGFCLAAGFRCFPFPLHLNQGRCLLKPCNGKFLNALQ